MNGAELDPIEPGELYKEWQSFIRGDAPRFHADQLDGQEYQPAPQIVPDTQEGYDLDGNYHALEQTAVEGLGQAITPYRWASYLEDAVQQLCQGNDYHTGRAERCDIAEQIFNDRLARAATEQEQIALHEALQVWYRSYGHGN